jgi:hypothetical protein
LILHIIFLYIISHFYGHLRILIITLVLCKLNVEIFEQQIKDFVTHVIGIFVHGSIDCHFPLLLLLQFRCWVSLELLFLLRFWGEHWHHFNLLSFWV